MSQSSLLSDGVRIRTQLPHGEPGLFWTPPSLPCCDKGDEEDKLGGEGREMATLTWRKLSPPGQHLGHPTPTILDGRHSFFLAYIGISSVPHGFKIAISQSNRNANEWDFWNDSTGGLSWLIWMCLYDVFDMKSSEFSKPTCLKWHLSIYLEDS